MRFNLILRILGLLAIFNGAAMLLPIPFSLYYGDDDYIALLISSAISFAFGAFGFISTKKREDIRPKEGFAVVAMGWIILAAFGSLPFVISGAIPSYTDAFFETISGFTTTGASILRDIESVPHGVLFWRSLTHWIGGMGIIVMSVAILPFLGVGGMQLFKAEVPGPVVDKLKPRITETAKILWGVYLLFSAAETILLLFGGMSLFDALCHTFGTMATGGFSTRNASVGAFGSAYIDFVIIFFMIIAGINFSLHYRLLKGKFGEFFGNGELKFFLFIILIAFGIIAVDVYIRMGTTIFETIQYTLFQVVSIITTTGFGTHDYEQWSASSHLILFFLMFIGGCAGSTGGGMKVLRIYLLFKFMRSELILLLHPKAKVAVTFGRAVVDRGVMANIAGFFVLYVFLTVIAVIVMALLGLDFITALGAVAATINNIGPGLGTVGPTENYAHMPDAGKWVLSFLMLVGRLEVFTVVILFVPSFWKK